MLGWESLKALATASEPLTKDQKVTSPEAGAALVGAAELFAGVVESAALEPQAPRAATMVSEAVTVAALRQFVMGVLRSLQRWNAVK